MIAVAAAYYRRVWFYYWSYMYWVDSIYIVFYLIAFTYVRIEIIVNQSIFIYIRQPEPIVARPVYIKIKKRKAHTTQYKYYHTDKREKRKTKPLLERNICCRRSRLHFSTISSKCGKANSLNIMITLYTIKLTVSEKYFDTFHISRLKFGKCSRRKITPKSNIIKAQAKSSKQL